MRHLTSVLMMLTILSAMTMSLHSQDVVFKNNGSKALLIELYSSEGCSSCPPAEDWIGTLKNSPGLWKDLFPVSFHVDYWDGLGWPDRFAKASYTQRQQDYATRLGQDSLYTPEFVMSGHEWRGWFHGERNPSAEKETSGELTLQVKDGGKQISALYSPSSQVGSRTFTANVALLGFNVVSDVKRGENGGRQLRHDFVVLDFESKPMTKGPHIQSGPLSLKSSTGDPPGAVVAWVSTSHGSIEQIAGGWLKPLLPPN